MATMIVGLVLFLGAHSMQVFAAPLRARIIKATGEIPYKVVYSLISLGGLILIAQGYTEWRFQGSPQLYTPPTWMVHVALLLNLFAFISLFATYPPGYIKKALKHPMITAVKIWAFAHLLSNGDIASVVLFGAFLAWGVIDRISVKRRERAGLTAPLDYKPKILADVVAVGVGTIVYVLFVWKVHLWLIGVSPIATSG
ncbi:MAG: NnrU family protein [Devosia sp.]